MKKKKVIHKRTSRTIHHRTASKIDSWSFHRIVILGTVACLLIITVLAMENTQIRRSVAGASITSGLFSEAIIPLPQVAGATSYDIYYAPIDSPTFIFAISDIPTNIPSYAISRLRNGVTYKYQISAKDLKGSEYWFSSIQTITNEHSM